MGLSKPDRLFCIYVVVDNVIIIKCQCHNKLNLFPPCTVARIMSLTYALTPRHLETLSMLAVESIKVLADSVSFVKGRGCNDKVSVFPHHLIIVSMCMCVVVWTNMDI